jgi:cytoskeletal protein RodZ
MGISDDIVPKRPHHHTQRDVDSVEDSEVKLPHFVEDKIASESKNDSDQEEAEDFFKKETEPVPDKKPAKKRSIGRFMNWVAILLIIILFGYLLIQNFHKIESIVTGSNKTTSNTNTASQDTTSTSSDQSTTEINPQDYTATSTAQDTTTTTTPTATTPTLDKTSFTLQVLNGNGVSGSAASVKSALVAAGFNVTNTTNAKSFSYTQTYVYFKTGKDEAAAAVKDALSSRTVTTELSDTIAKTYDIVVVVGSK